MTIQWDHQIRIQLTGAFAEVARRDPDNPAIKSLTDILTKHHATMKCQFDAFAEYVAEAEKHGPQNYPLYEWTKSTLESPQKEKKYSKSFTLNVRGKDIYAKNIAEALESDLHPLVGGALITRMSNHDTNPANNPQPPAGLRK